jgi:hypothetical protein
MLENVTSLAASGTVGTFAEAGHRPARGKKRIKNGVLRRAFLVVRRVRIDYLGECQGFRLLVLTQIIGLRTRFTNIFSTLMRTGQTDRKSPNGNGHTNSLRVLPLIYRFASECLGNAM